MVIMRVVRHDRHEQVLAECQSTVLPVRGEAIQLDTVDESGEQSRPSTIWNDSESRRITWRRSARPPRGGSALTVASGVGVSVLPDVALVPELPPPRSRLVGIKDVTIVLPCDR
jgi:hypothetical protein